MTTFRLPMILQQTVPFVALFVGMTALISLNRRYELVIDARGRHFGLAVPAALRHRRASSSAC